MPALSVELSSRVCVPYRVVVRVVHPLDIGGRLTESEKIDPQAVDQSVKRMIGCNSSHLEA